MTDWKEQLETLVDEYATASYLVSGENHPVQEEEQAMVKVTDFISTEIIEPLMEEARDKVRQCESPRNITEPPAEALKEAKLINRMDAMDAIDEVKKDWLS